MYGNWMLTAARVSKHAAGRTPGRVDRGAAKREQNRRKAHRRHNRRYC